MQWASSSAGPSQSQPSAVVASQPLNADVPPAACLFEIAHAKLAQLVAMFGDDDRPCVKKILRLDVV